MAALKARNSYPEDVNLLSGLYQNNGECGKTGGRRIHGTQKGKVMMNLRN